MSLPNYSDYKILALHTQSNYIFTKIRFTQTLLQDGTGDALTNNEMQFDKFHYVMVKDKQTNIKD